MKHIQLSDHFKISTILLFSLPSIGMQLVDNTYQVADGYFISNYISSSAFAAENLIFPPLALFAGIGLMFGSGATALISNALGKGDKERANKLLTFTTLTLAILGIILSTGLFIFMPLIARFVGADESLIPHCVEYGRILAACMPFQMLSSAFHPLLITAERPSMGLITSIVNACVNILLDWFMVAVISWGLTGAALATGLAWAVSAIIPIIFFMNKERTLHFSWPHWDGIALLRTCYNGSSEMVDAISYAIVAMLFNFELIHYAGENGVASYAVSEYVTGFLAAIFYGISMSITPVVGYNSGRKDKTELRSILKNGFIVTGGLGILMSVLGIVFAEQIAEIFVGYDSELMKMSVHALRIVSLSFILVGITTFSSAFFTGMEEGTASLIVASVKSFIMPLILVILLPLILGTDGIWLVTTCSEVIALVVAVLFFLRYKSQNLI